MRMQNRLARLVVGLVAAAALSAGAAMAQQSHAEEDKTLEASVQSMITAYHGKVAVYAEDMSNGKKLAIHADTPVKAASVIKLAVLYEALEQIRAGKAHFEDRIMLKHHDQVSGSGILMFFDTPQTITFKDVLTMMIIVSDNTGTNLAIDHLGLKNINDRIVSIGLHDTWLYKKIGQPSEAPMPPDQPQFGLGKTTAREMAAILKRFVTCDLDPPGAGAAPAPGDHALCDAALHMLKNQFYRDSIPRYLETIDSTESDSAIADKTGALDAVRNDVGVVFTRQGPVLLSLFTYDNADQGWSVDNEGEVLMARLAKTIVDAWRPAATPAAAAAAK